MLFLLLACQPEETTPEKIPEEPTDTAEQEDSAIDSGTEEEDTSEEDTGPGYTDPWPEEEASWENHISVVYEGELVSMDGSIQLQTAPAGIDFSSDLQLIITNRSGETISFDSNPDSWLSLQGFSWVSSVPTTLAPEETVTLDLSFNPILETQEITHSIPLHFPTTAGDLSINIEVQVPPPLRMVFVGNDGYTLISDDYGQSISNEHIPAASSGISMIDVEWGEEVFLRASTTSSVYSNDGVIYEYSADGISWSSSLVSDAGAPFDCEYGLDSFLCVRGWGASFSHSEDGSVVLHSDSNYAVGSFINQLVFTGEHFVGVGRDGYRAVASTLEYFDYDSVISDSDLGHLEDIAYGDGLVIGVGGWSADQHTVVVSPDGGFSWDELVLLDETQWASLWSIAFNDGVWLIDGNQGYMYRSYDGYTWQSFAELGFSGDYTLLGAYHGWFFGYDDSSLYRTEDGENWELIHVFAQDQSIISMASQSWEEL